MMEASPYAANLTAPMQRAATILNERVASGALPGVSRLGIWSCIVSHVMERFVEGVSSVKKCSPGGRGLMTVDAGTIYDAAAKLGPALPQFLPRDKGYVDGYVSVFYYDSDGDVLAWMAKNKQQYSLRHMRAVITNGIGVTLKKAKLRDAMIALESMYLAVSPTAASGGAGTGVDAMMGGLGLKGLGMGTLMGGSV